MMNPEIKAKWLEDLRSGKFKQTEGTLKSTEGGYCCLGVLCESMGYQWEEGKTGDYVVAGEFDEQNEPLECNLNNNILNRTGITTDEQGKLVSMNDSEGKSFLEIADYVEKHL
jgi:hypothetical protein